MPLVIAMSFDFQATFFLFQVASFNFSRFLVMFFFSRCKDEHIKREATLQNTATKGLLLGFAMFEAELFCNYRVRFFFYFYFNLCILMQKGTLNN